jgi:hypothetical protein
VFEESGGLKEIDGLHEREADEQWYRYWDDITGKELDEEKVKEARRGEIQEIHICLGTFL